MFGFKISLPGKDISSTNPQDFAVHSEYPSPKISSTASPAHFAAVNYTFPSDPADGTTRLLTVAHGLPYVPDAFCLFGDVASASAYFNPAQFAVLGETQMIECYTNATNLCIDYVCDNNASVNHVNMNGLNLILRYYIFAQSGQTFP